MKKNSIGFLIVVFFLIFRPEITLADLATEFDTVVVTATRIAQHNYKIASNTTLITRDQIENSNARNIPDILKEVVGVNIYDFNTSKSAVVDIRGFGDTAARNILVLIDGRKVNAIDISGPDLIQVPIESVERIEIIRGAGSVLYGDNAVGGVINIITKKGSGEFSGRLGGTLGSYDARSIDMEVSGAKDNFSYYMYSQYNDDRGYRDNSDLLAKDYKARLGYELGDHTSIDLNMGWHEDDQKLPGGLSDAELQTVGRRAAGDPDDFSSTKDRFVKLGINTTPWPEDDYFGNFDFSFFYRNRDVYDEFNSFSNFHTKRSIDTYGITGKYIFDRTVFNKEVNFVTGVDYFDTENDILGSQANVDDVTISKEEMGIYGFLQYEALNKLFVNGGTRYHQARYAFSQRNVAVDQKQRPDEWVWMGGLKYEYMEGSNMHMNVQRTFRFLATDEWYTTANFPTFGITPGLNLNLEQQTGMQYEAGVKHAFDDMAIIMVTPYWIDIKNEIFFDPVTFANNNYDKTRKTGVEFGAKVDLLKVLNVDFLDTLDIFSNYNYQHAKFRGGTNDKKYIPFVAKHQASGGLITGFLEHFKVSLIGRYVGARFAINDTLNVTAPIKPYYVLDTKVAYENGPLEVYVAVDNVADEEYFTFVSKSVFSTAKQYFPAEERNYTIGVNFEF